MLDGVTDLAVCSTELTQPERFEILFTREEQLRVVTAEGLSLAVQDGLITPEALRRLPLAVSGGCMEMLRRYFPNWEEEFQVLAVCTTKYSALAWAMTGEAAAVVPMEAGERLWPGLCSAPLNAPDMILQKSIVRARNHPLSHLAKVFLEYYRDLRRAPEKWRAPSPGRPPVEMETEQKAAVRKKTRGAGGRIKKSPTK